MPIFISRLVQMIASLTNNSLYKKRVANCAIKDAGPKYNITLTSLQMHNTIFAFIQKKIKKEKKDSIKNSLA